MPHRPLRLLTGLLLVATLLAGCSTVPTVSPLSPVAAPTAAAGATIFDGRTGERLDWTAVGARLDRAGVVLVGEQHDNVVGHRIEAHLTDQLLNRAPRAAIALEMFERHEQGLVDAYLDGRIAATTLVSLTESENWGGGKNTWMDWYHPIVDHVKARRASGATVIAANAPRTYAKLARLESYAALASLPADERAWFTLPDLGVDDHAYRDRFLGTMSAHSAPATAAPPSPAPAAPKPVSAMMGKPEDFFRAQQVWDATMADSVLRAHRRHPKVMLFVGEFHVGYAGGILQRVKHGAPKAKIETISILRATTPATFDAEDKDRADIVIYTPIETANGATPPN